MVRPSMMEMGWQMLWAENNHDLNEGRRTQVPPGEEINEEKVGSAVIPGHQV